MYHQIIDANINRVSEGLRVIEDYTRFVAKNKTITSSVKQALTAGADGIIVTGSWTGIAPELSKLSEGKKAAKNMPVLIGSGLTINNSKTMLQIANGALVGTAIRNKSRISYKKAKKLTTKVKKIYGGKDGN